MPSTTGRNKNSNDVARVEEFTLTSTQSTKIADINPERMFFSVCLAPATANVDVFIRLYPNADDNNKRGEVLTRRLSGNDSLFRPNWQMPVDTIYTGEISAISNAGNVDIIVTEY